MTCYRCSSGCVPVSAPGTGCESDSFLYHDACVAWCGTTPGWSPAPSRSPSHSPSRSPSRPQPGAAVLKAHNVYRSAADYDHPDGKADVLQWDAGLEKEAKSWADELVARCGEESLLDGNIPGRNVTKITGAPAPFHYNWTEVVDSWLFEGCAGDFWKASVQEQQAQYAHFMTASLRNQRTVGCAQAFVKECSATGKSLQAFVCEYGEGAPPAGTGLYPSDPASQSLCALGRPFPVSIE